MVLLPYHPPPRKGNDYEEICPSEYECHQSSASEVDCNADNYEEINVDQSITSFESEWVVLGFYKDKIIMFYMFRDSITKASTFFSARAFGHPI